MNPIVASIIKIASWFFNPERWSARRKDKKFNEFKKWEDELAKALKDNDTKMISTARYKLGELRLKYGISNK